MTEQTWERFKRFYSEFSEAGLALDLSRTFLEEDFFHRREPQLQQAFSSMDELERGGTANPDEKRMVGHYWLRSPELAPTAQIRNEIETTLEQVKKFAGELHS